MKTHLHTSPIVVKINWMYEKHPRSTLLHVMFNAAAMYRPTVFRHETKCLVGTAKILGVCDK